MWIWEGRQGAFGLFGVCGGGVCQPLSFQTDSSSSIGAQGMISIEPTPFISWKQNLLLRLTAPTHNPEEKNTIQKLPRSCEEKAELGQM